MIRFERLFRNRAGTTLYAVLRTSDDYRVVEWAPIDEDGAAMIEIGRFECGDRPFAAKNLAVEMARSEAASN